MMRSGDEFFVHHSGLRLTPKQAGTLGLLDGAKAYARWVEGENASTHTKLSKKREQDIDPACQGPNLVVSPIHPDRWPAVFVIEVRLRRKPGALRTVLAKMREIGINVLTIQSVAAGFGLSIVTAICELPKMTERVRARIQNLDDAVIKLRGSALDALRRHDTEKQRVCERKIQFMRASAMRETGLDQLATGCVVGSKLRIWDSVLRGDDAQRIQETDSVGGISSNGDPGFLPFLHRRTRQMGLQPWFLDRSRVENLDDLSERAIQLGLLAPTNPRMNERRCLSEQFALYYRALMREDGTEALEDLYEIEIEEAVVRARQKYLLKEQEREDDGDRYLVREYWRNLGYEPVRVHPLISLAYARHWVVPDRHGLEFQYRAVSNLLELQSDDKEQEDRLMDDFASIAEIDRDELDEPVVSLGYLHPQERYLRLRMLRGWFSREFAGQLDLSYEWRSQEHLRAPSGLLEQISAHLQSQSLNIERIENSLLEVTDHYEEGRVRVVFAKSERAVRPNRDDRRAELNKIMSGVREQIEAAQSRGRLVNLTIGDISVLPLDDALLLRAGPI